MPPKAGHWCTADDEKLEQLIRARGNGITTNRDKANIERISEHWPHRKGNKGFASLLRGKLEKFEIHGAVSGRRAGEFWIVVFLISLSILYLTFDSFLAQAAANGTGNSSEESSYAGSNQSDISLGSVDSDLEEEEIEDPEEQVTMPPKTPRKTPMKAAASATKKSQKNSSGDVLILAENLSKTSLSSNGISFTYLCPTLRFTCRDGDKDAALYEFHTPLPQQFLRHCKVIDGGMKLSILFGFPRVLTTEKAHKKVLGTEGITYDPNLARVAARSTQVTHFVNSHYDSTVNKLEGDPQICVLPFKCTEGNVPSSNIHWLKWPTGFTVVSNGVEHKQFLNILLVKLNSIATYAVERQEQDEFVLDDSGDDDMEHGDLDL